MGVYVNSPNDLIAFCEREFHWVKNGLQRSIRYDFVESVRISDHPYDLELELRLGNGDVILIPVSNETEDVPDIYAVHDFLVSAIYWPHSSSNPEQIAKIESREELIKFLLEQEEGWHRYGTIINALSSGFPERSQLRFFNLDEKLLDQPEVWRLLAVFLCKDFEERWEDNRAEFYRRPRIYD